MSRRAARTLAVTRTFRGPVLDLAAQHLPDVRQFDARPAPHRRSVRWRRDPVGAEQPRRAGRSATRYQTPAFTTSPYGSTV